MNISVLLPVHVCDDTVTPMLSVAVETVATQEKLEVLPQIYVVFPVDIKESIVGWRDSMLRKYQDKVKFVLVENEGKSDFQTQVNLGASKIETDYFSILEFDDEYSTTYFFNAEKYIKHYSDVDVFLTMMVETNQKGEALKITNELVWAQQFVGENGEMGYLNANALKQNTDFKLSGAIIDREEFLSLGGLKSNIKLTFNYEFLLRALNNACKIHAIAKIGYKHLAEREDSLFGGYSKNMPPAERKFWFDTASREANFNNDRVIDTTSLQKIVVEEK